MLEAASVSYGKATTFLPVIDLLKDYFQIEPRDDTRKISEKVTGKLFSLDRALESCLAPLLWVLDVPVEDEGWKRLDPSLRRRHLLDSLPRGFCGRACAYWWSSSRTCTGRQRDQAFLDISWRPADGAAAPARELPSGIRPPGAAATIASSASTAVARERRLLLEAQLGRFVNRALTRDRAD